jgi:DNA-binding IclR family transcriptional regulator
VVNVNWVGKPTPLHCTSNGKALLSSLPDSDRDRLLAAPLERFTPDTITDPDLLRAQLLEADVRGYAYTIEELEEGLNAVAAPVRGPDGRVMAAVSVAGPAFRLTPKRIASTGRTLVAAAAEISRRMGHLGQSSPGGGAAAGSDRAEGGNA